ncbi:MAG: hypothetical protein K9I80_12915, partial [Ignavibacteriales bacterium]|nr:hypothetical protein [Ignavibacteriales bacterium]
SSRVLQLHRKTKRSQANHSIPETIVQIIVLVITRCRRHRTFIEIFCVSMALPQFTNPSESVIASFTASS